MTICLRCNTPHDNTLTACSVCGAALSEDAQAYQAEIVSKETAAPDILGKFVSASMVPIMVMNFLSGIVGGAWLLLLGQWRVVLLGFLTGMMFPWAYSIIALVQGVLFIVPTTFLLKKVRPVGMVMAFLNSFFGHAVGIFWGVVVFIHAFSLAHRTDNISLPFFLYGWTVAIGPFQYMASKEPPDALGTYLALYLFQLSYLLLIAAYFMHIAWLWLPSILILTICFEIYLLKTISRFNDEML